MDSIRMKVTEAESQYKLQLLTLAPQSCSHETITHFFGVSDYTVHQSRKLFKQSGILGDVESKKGKQI